MKSNFIRLSAVLMSFVFVFLLVCPAFAEEINYRDYETNVKVDGDRDLVTVEFPTSWIKGMIGDRTGTGIVKWDGPVLDRTLNFSVQDELRLYCAPFGTIFSSYTGTYNGRYLSLDNIPSDAEFTIEFGYGGNATDIIVWEAADERYYSVDGTYAEYYSKFIYDLDVSGDKYFTFTSTVSDGSGKGWFPMYIFTIQSLGNDFNGSRFYLEVTKFKLEISISSLYRLQEQSGITNELLTEVNKQLAEQGKTMDDILHGTPEQNESADNSAGILGDKGEQLGGLVDDIQTEKPNLDSVDVDKIIPSAGITSLSAAISPIAENPLVIKILVMVGTLLLVSYVLFGKKG